MERSILRKQQRVTSDEMVRVRDDQPGINRGRDEEKSSGIKSEGSEWD
jgi:hypothetical protein